MLRPIFPALALIISLAANAFAGPAEDLYAAYTSSQRGDYATAIRLLRPLADRGNATAQVSLGLLYLNGQGVLNDDVEAIRLFELAARQGDAWGQNNLGRMYMDGRGVVQNDGEAVRLLRLAARQGNVEARVSLGYMYEKGRGVANDDAEAARLYQLAVNQGSLAAQNNLGLMYWRGRGVPQNDAEALRLFKLAGDKGWGPALFNLGLMYREGRAVPKNEAEATRLFKLALDKGFVGAAQYLSSDRVPSATPSDRADNTVPGTGRFEIRLKKVGGVYVVPVTINGMLTLDFTLDSGASDVSIPSDVVMTLMRTGTITKADFLETQTYELADGSTMPSQTFRIRSLIVGDRVLENVVGSVAPAKGSLLLGQSLLSRFKSWSIDNQRQVLVLDDVAQAPPVQSSIPPRKSSQSGGQAGGGYEPRRVCRRLFGLSHAAMAGWSSVA
jgi:TPR repeat protein